MSVRTIRWCKTHDRPTTATGNVCDFEEDLDERCRVPQRTYLVVPAALTADGPVILLPDEGEGVRVAKLADIRDAMERGDQFHSWVDDLEDAAREMAK